MRISLKPLGFALALILSDPALAQGPNLETVFEHFRNGGLIEPHNPDHQKLFEIYIKATFQNANSAYLKDLGGKIKKISETVLENKVQKESFENVNVINTQTLFDSDPEVEKIEQYLNIKLKNFFFVNAAAHDSWYRFYKKLNGTFEAKKITDKIVKIEPTDVEGLKSWIKKNTSQDFLNEMAKFLVSEIKSNPQNRTAQERLHHLAYVYGVFILTKKLEKADGREQVDLLTDALSSQVNEFEQEVLQHQVRIKDLVTDDPFKIKEKLEALQKIKPQLKVKQVIKNEYTIRQLSVLENGLISGLGTGCTTGFEMLAHTEKPYHSFTLTNPEGQSQGHVTFYVGHAGNQKVALIEQIHSIPVDQIPEVLEVMKQTLARKGYRLALFDDLKNGKNNGITNETTTIGAFMQNWDVYKKAQVFREPFQPDTDPNQTKHATTHSRIHEGSDLRLLPQTSWVNKELTPHYTSRNNSTLSPQITLKTIKTSLEFKNQKHNDLSLRSYFRQIQTIKDIAEFQDLAQEAEQKAFDLYGTGMGKFDMEILNVFHADEEKLKKLFEIINVQSKDENYNGFESLKNFVVKLKQKNETLDEDLILEGLKNINFKQLVSLIKNFKYPLHSASTHGKLEVVETLLKLAPHLATDEKFAKDNYGGTALHLAAGYGKLEVVETLLKLTPHLATDEKFAKDNNGGTALHFAAEYGELNVVETLLKSAPHLATDEKFAKENDGWTALHLAAGYGKLEVVETLLKSAPHLTTDEKFAKDNDGWTALHLAVRYGYLEIGETLLKLAPHLATDEKFAKDNDGQTALHLAAEYGELNVVETLLKLAPHLATDEKFAKDNEGRTPEDLGNKDVKEIFKKWRLQFNEKTKSNETPPPDKKSSPTLNTSIALPGLEGGGTVEQSINKTFATVRSYFKSWFPNTYSPEYKPTNVTGSLLPLPKAALQKKIPNSKIITNRLLQWARRWFLAWNLFYYHPTHTQENLSNLIYDIPSLEKQLTKNEDLKNPEDLVLKIEEALKTTHTPFSEISGVIKTQHTIVPSNQFLKNEIRLKIEQRNLKTGKIRNKTEPLKTFTTSAEKENFSRTRSRPRGR